jgi:hypothetical protein
MSDWVTFQRFQEAFFDFVQRELPDIKAGELTYHLVECTACVIVGGAKLGHEEAAAVVVQRHLEQVVQGLINTSGTRQ